MSSCERNLPTVDSWGGSCTCGLSSLCLVFGRRALATLAGDTIVSDFEAYVDVTFHSLPIRVNNKGFQALLLTISPLIWRRSGQSRRTNERFFETR